MKQNIHVISGAGDKGVKTYYEAKRSVIVEKEKSSNFVKFSQNQNELYESNLHTIFSEIVLFKKHAETENSEITVDQAWPKRVKNRAFVNNSRFDVFFGKFNSLA